MSFSYKKLNNSYGRICLLTAISILAIVVPISLQEIRMWAVIMFFVLMGFARIYYDTEIIAQTRDLEEQVKIEKLFSIMEAKKDANEAIQSLTMKFTSGNSISTERATILRREWDAIQNLFVALDVMRKEDKSKP